MNVEDIDSLYARIKDSFDNHSSGILSPQEFTGNWEHKAWMWISLDMKMPPEAWQQPEELVLSIMGGEHTLNPISYKLLLKLVDSKLRRGETSVESFVLCLIISVRLRLLEPHLRQACWEALIFSPWSLQPTRLREITTKMFSVGCGSDLINLAGIVYEQNPTYGAQLYEAIVESQLNEGTPLEKSESIVGMEDPTVLLARNVQEVMKCLFALYRHYEKNNIHNYSAYVVSKAFERIVTKLPTHETNTTSQDEFIAKKRNRESPWVFPLRMWYQKIFDEKEFINRQDIEELIRIYDVEEKPDVLKQPIETMLVYLHYQERKKKDYWQLFHSCPGHMKHKNKIVESVDWLRGANSTPPKGAYDLDDFTRSLIVYTCRIHLRLGVSRNYIPKYAYELIEYANKVPPLKAELQSYYGNIEEFLISFDPIQASRKIANVMEYLVRKETSVSKEERTINEENDQFLSIVKGLPEFPDFFDCSVAEEESNWVLESFDSCIDELCRGEMIDKLLGLSLETSNIVSLKQHALDLEKMAKGKVIATGALSGIVASIASPIWGGAAVMADVAFTVRTTIQLIANHAAIFGIDPRSPKGKFFVLSCLLYGLSKPERKMIGIALFQEITTDTMALQQILFIGAQFVVRKRTQYASMQMAIRILARKIGFLLTEGQLTKIVPVVNAVAGGVMNYQFVSEASKAAVQFGYFSQRVKRLDNQGDAVCLA